MLSYEEKLNNFLKNHSYEHKIVNGGNFKYIDSGDKSLPSVVCLNGGMNTMEMWLDYPEKLSPDYRVIMFDYPIEITENTKMADAIVKFLSMLGIDKAFFIGASYGGIMAQVITKTHPEVVCGLGLFSTAGLDETTIKNSKKKYKFFPLLINYMKKCNYEKLKPKLIKSSEKYMKQESDENKEYILGLFRSVFKNYTAEKDIHITSLMVQVMEESPCTPENFEFLHGNILAVFPEKDYFSKTEQESLIKLTGNPKIKYIKNGHYGTMLEADKYCSWIKQMYAHVLKK